MWPKVFCPIYKYLLTSVTLAIKTFKKSFRNIDKKTFFLGGGVLSNHRIITKSCDFLSQNIMTKCNNNSLSRTVLVEEAA